MGKLKKTHTHQDYSPNLQIHPSQKSKGFQGMFVSLFDDYYYSSFQFEILCGWGLSDFLDEFHLVSLRRMISKE